MKNYVWLIGFILCTNLLPAYTQKGTIRIFSELKGIQIYLDEVLQGTDLASIDSVSPGTHYFKAQKDQVIVYSDLVNVNANSITTILIKNTKEVQDKLLDSKFEDIQKYKSNRLDVLLSAKYETNSSGVTNSIYFPGYYFATGTSYTNSQSVTQQQTDWFVVKGGKLKITEMELARLAGDQDAISRIQNTNEQINKHNVKIMKRMNAGGIMLVTGTLAALVGLSDVLLANWLSDDLAAYLFAGGLGLGLFGYMVVEFNDTEPYPNHYLTLEEAIKLAETYNKNLKKSLGLPDNIEP